ncbi:MAG: tetratricopeptide repeat protein, partial [Pseudobdellovibrionaceae bacterium]
MGTSGHSQMNRVKDAEKLAKEEKWTDVVNLLKTEAVSLNRKGKLLLANAYMKTNNTSGQVQVLNSVIAENDKDYEALVLLGQTHLNATPKNNDEAALSFRNALVGKKDYLPAYKGLIQVYENTKNNYELRILYLDMIKFMGEKPEFVSSLCRLDSQDGFLDTARKWCNKGMLLDPNNAENQVYLGISLRDSGQEKQAIQILKKAADTYAKSDLAQLKYADFLAEKKDNLGAMKYYQRATNANLKLSPAWDGLAHASLAL